MVKRTYYVTIERCWDEIEVEAENREEAIKEAEDTIQRGWITKIVAKRNRRRG